MVCLLGSGIWPEQKLITAKTHLPIRPPDLKPQNKFRPMFNITSFFVYSRYFYNELWCTQLKPMPNKITSYLQSQSKMKINTRSGRVWTKDLLELDCGTSDKATVWH